MRRAIFAGAIGLAATAASYTIFAGGGAPPAGPTTSPVQRPPVEPPSTGTPIGKTAPAKFPFEFRTIDGVSNNGEHPLWGAAGTPLIRLAPAEYGGDGAGEIPAGADRPSPRHVSNALCAQGTDIVNQRNASAFLWQWGQFLDHDIDETPVASPAVDFDIPVPVGDPHFDPRGKGGVTIPLDRSAFEMIGGVRQQLNNITAFIDASNVYGADPNRALELRTLDGTGRLKTSAGNLLPFNVNGFPNAPSSADPTMFLAGDIRANEQAGLTAMHTLFVREHNFWADRIHAANPNFSDDRIYEYARAIVGAEMQAITVREFLPMLLGPDPLPPYAGYRKKVNPAIANMFATAGYRVGHTLLSSPLMRIDENNEEIPAGHLALAQAFFNPQLILDDGIDCLLRGLCSKPSQEIDPFILDDVRNFLFGPPGAGGFDLASLNIQRGRDHGLPSYNNTRIAFSMPAAKSFADVTPDLQMQKKLAAAYDNVDQIDLWVGLLAEPHRPGAMVGETLFRLLRNQFTRLRDGDRFWYQSYLPQKYITMVEQRTLGVIIRANTEIGSEMPINVFDAPIACDADLDGSGVVDEMDLQLLIKAWGPCPGCPEDLTGDDIVDLADVEVLIDAWGKCG